MKILIAEDNLTSRTILESILKKWGYTVVSAGNGNEAWAALQAEGAPRLAILDWMMPGLNGLELCKLIRQRVLDDPAYIILLTVRDSKDDIVVGLDAGANDYVTKPFDNDELRARIQVGRRVLELQTALANNVKELQQAFLDIKTLRGIVPICMHCHKIRTDDQAWERIEKYVTDHSEAEFSHGICPECMKKYYSKEE